MKQLIQELDQVQEQQQGKTKWSSQDVQLLQVRYPEHEGLVASRHQIGCKQVGSIIGYPVFHAMDASWHDYWLLADILSITS
jgi:hypothetical protein